MLFQSYGKATNLFNDTFPNRNYISKTTAVKIVARHLTMLIVFENRVRMNLTWFLTFDMYHIFTNILNLELQLIRNGLTFLNLVSSIVFRTVNL